MFDRETQMTEDQPVHQAAREGVQQLAVLLDRDASLRDRPGWYGRKPLHAAAEAGCFECVDLLLKRKAPVDAREDLHEQTALHHAVSADSIECVDRLLKAGANVNASDARGETPAFYARSLGVIERLATAGANLNVISGRGQYAFQYCAAYVRSVKVIQFWMDHKVPINHVPDFGWPALSAVCAMPYTPNESPDYDRDSEIMELLLAHGADVNLPDKQGDTALYSCCINQHVRLAEFLLNHGAKCNLTNRSGDSALHAAVFRENVQLVRKLLDHGADVNIANRHHKTPFDISASGSAIRNLLLPSHRPSGRPVPAENEVLRRLKAIPRFRAVPFNGCSKGEVAHLESEFGVRLPAAYRDFLETMGKGAGDFLVSDHWTFRFDDLFGLARSDDYAEQCDLPDDYFVFAEREGCQWVFFVADGKSDDPPVFLFDDGHERTCRQIARSIWEFIDSMVTDYEIWSGV
jgi:ankyrin repeat protein